MDHANDNYVILRKVGRHYSPTITATGRSEAIASVVLLEATEPGDYLLLNLRTRITETSEEAKSAA